MKTLTKILMILAAFLALGWSSQRHDKSLQTNWQRLVDHQSSAAVNSDPLYVEGVITVKLKPGVGEFRKQTGVVHFGIPTLDEKVAAFGVYRLEKRFRYNPAKLRPGLPDLSRIYKISFPESISVKEVAEAFSENPNVEYAEPITIPHLLEVPNDSLFSQMQHLPQIHAPEAWDIHKGENGTEEIIIAINDSGVDWDHVDLRENIWQNLAEDADSDGHTMEYDGIQWVLDPGDLNGVDDDGNGFTDDLIGWNFLTNSNNPYPIPGIWEGHGTHCAGISNGSTNNGAGIASISWNLSLMPICVFPSSISFGFDGIIYAAENGADIISNSWGGGGYSIAEQEAINYATSLGSIVVAGAGNENNDEYFYPASYQNVISVASVNTDDTKASYSTYNYAVDISAPGGGTEGIWSTIPGNAYGLGLGTSMAAPCIAGCFGLLKSYHPDWSNDQLIIQLLGTADNIDSLNPDYINMLGSGRVNAYRMLTEDNVLPFLRLQLVSFTAEDENGNNINEPGEQVTLSFDLHNHMQCAGSDNVNVTLSTDDPDITIISSSTIVNIPPDSAFSIEDQFQVQVGLNAQSHFAKLTLHFEADIPITMGQDIDFGVLVAPSGIFVYEGKEGERDNSGAFISNFLDRLGFDYTYYNIYPATLLGFETVFLSHGNFGALGDKGTMFTEEHSLMVQEFLENGGKVYIEMGGMFKKMITYGNISAMKQLFGVNYMLNPYGNNPVDTLMGLENTPMEDMFFTRSHQLYNYTIDKLIPDSGAMIPFLENDYGNVSIMNEDISTYDCKTFYLSYALAELYDRDATSSRYNILLKVMEFFGYDPPQGFIISNFTAENTVGAPPLEVHFTDISVSDPANPVNSWQWDFDEDGITDSYEQNPSWTYSDTISYDVKLITSNGISSDTLVREDLTLFNYGCLVYEGDPEGNDYSGAFIRDYLQEQGYTVTYRNILPQNLQGFSAVFLSFGNACSVYTVLDEKMAITLIDYLEDGGHVYLEGADALGMDQSTNSLLLNLLGLASASDGSLNPIDNLAGQPAAITHDMVFTGNSQVSNEYIDLYTPLSNSVISFNESNYGTVGIQHIGSSGCRTFCFSYALSKLNDGEFPNTREELLNRIINFFDISTSVPELQVSKTNRLIIYPNPSKGKITISSPAITANTQLSIFNVSGEKVIERRLINCETQIDISTLPRGVYFVRLQNEKMVEVTKMVKESRIGE